MNLIFLLVALFTLSSCASITTGTNQAIAVQTTPESGANCELSNDKGKWFVSSTPETVSVKRAYSDLTVTCHRGSYSGVTSLHSSTKGMAFGNIIFGGIIGGAVDAGSGAAYDYPSTVKVQLNPPKN